MIHKRNYIRNISGQIKADTETPQALSQPEKTKYNYSERK